MEKLPKWVFTKTLPAYEDSESFTALEGTYKVYQAMNNLIDDYNKFVDNYNSEWEQFKTKYNNDIETFTLAMRQEFQDFIESVDIHISTWEQSTGADIQTLKNEVNTIKTIIASDDVNLDTLQELVNALKNNVSSINDIFTELAKKVDKTEYNTKVSNIENDVAKKENKYIGVISETMTLVGLYGHILNNYSVSSIVVDLASLYDDTEIKGYLSFIGSSTCVLTDFLTGNVYRIEGYTDSTTFKHFIENCKLESGGGEKRYLHKVYVGNVFVEIVNNDSTPFTSTTFKEYLTNNNHTSNGNKLIARNYKTIKEITSNTIVLYDDAVMNNTTYLYLSANMMVVYTLINTITLTDGVFTSSGAKSYNWNYSSVDKDEVIEL